MLQVPAEYGLRVDKSETCNSKANNNNSSNNLIDTNSNKKVALRLIIISPPRSYFMGRCLRCQLAQRSRWEILFSRVLENMAFCSYRLAAADGFLPDTLRDIVAL